MCLPSDLQALPSLSVAAIHADIGRGPLRPKRACQSNPSQIYEPLEQMESDELP